MVQHAQIAPIIFVGTEPQDFLSLASQAQIGLDDRENPFFHHLRNEVGRNYVDTAKSQRLHLRRRPNQFKLAIASGPAAAKPKLFVENPAAGSLAILKTQPAKSPIFWPNPGHS